MWFTITAEIETEGYTLRSRLFTCLEEDVAAVHADIRASVPQGGSVVIHTKRS